VFRLSKGLEEARGSEKHLHHGTKANRDQQESTNVRHDERHAHLHQALIDAPAGNVATRIAGRCEWDHTPRAFGGMNPKKAGNSQGHVAMRDRRAAAFRAELERRAVPDEAARSLKRQVGQIILDAERAGGLDNGRSWSAGPIGQR